MVLPLTAVSRAPGKALLFLTLGLLGPRVCRREGGQRQTNRETDMETERQRDRGWGEEALDCPKA